MPEWKLLHSDPIALTKADAYRCVSSLFVTGLPSPSPSVTPLPKGEALREGQASASNFTFCYCLLQAMKPRTGGIKS